MLLSTGNWIGNNARVYSSCLNCLLFQPLQLMATWVSAHIHEEWVHGWLRWKEVLLWSWNHFSPYMLGTLIRRRQKRSHKNRRRLMSWGLLYFLLKWKTKLWTNIIVTSVVNYLQRKSERVRGIRFSFQNLHTCHLGDISLFRTYKTCIYPRSCTHTNRNWESV